MKLLIQLLALAFILQVADACCGSTWFGQCCSKGSCNIFCCNCYGGCDKCAVPNNDQVLALLSGLKPSDVPMTDVSTYSRLMNAKRRFESIDADKNRAIDMLEAYKYLTDRGMKISIEDFKQKFTAMDTNGDTVIVPGELDSVLKKIGDNIYLN